MIYDTHIEAEAAAFEQNKYLGLLQVKVVEHTCPTCEEGVYWTVEKIRRSSLTSS